MVAHRGRKVLSNLSSAAIPLAPRGAMRDTGGLFAAGRCGGSVTLFALREEVS